MQIKRYIQNSRKYPYFISGLLIIIIFGFLLIHKLGNIPNLFVDEATYMNEIRSIARHGTDMHGLHWPLYFAGVFGNGQSVEYAYLTAPLIKLFGFSITLARLPMVLFTLLTMFLILYMVRSQSEPDSLGFWLMLTLATSPWIFISARWILDCNIAPLTLLLGILALIQSWHIQQQRWSTLWTILSVFLIAASLYGYMAGWLYIPIMLLLIAIYVLRQHKMTLVNLLSYAIILALLAMPLIVFAYHFILLKDSTPGKFLWFSYPAMPVARMGSFIDFKAPHLIHTMLLNFVAGLQKYSSGSDGWAWNSVSGYGTIFPFMLGFSVLGILTPQRLLTAKAYDIKLVTSLSLLAFLPLMFVITPNYNHWNFINWLLAILAGYGLYLVHTLLGRRFLWSFTPILILMMTCFISLGYYGRLSSNETYFTSGDVSYRDLHKISTLMGSKHRLFTIDQRVKTLQGYAMLSDKSAKNNQQILSLSDNKQNFDLNNMSSHHRYGRIYDKTKLNKFYRRGDLLLVNSNNQQFTTGKNTDKYRVVYQLNFMNHPYQVLVEK